eukprot:3493966-Rhodomonas_salina.4
MGLLAARFRTRRPPSASGSGNARTRRECAVSYTAKSSTRNRIHGTIWTEKVVSCVWFRGVHAFWDPSPRRKGGEAPIIIVKAFVQVQNALVPVVSCTTAYTMSVPVRA